MYISNNRSSPPLHSREGGRTERLRCPSRPVTSHERRDENAFYRTSARRIHTYTPTSWRDVRWDFPNERCDAGSSQSPSRPPCPRPCKDHTSEKKTSFGWVSEGQRKRKGGCGEPPARLASSAISPDLDRPRAVQSYVREERWL
jgi:hypothetical protein